MSPTEDIFFIFVLRRFPACDLMRHGGLVSQFAHCYDAGRLCLLAVCAGVVRDEWLTKRRQPTLVLNGVRRLECEWFKGELGGETGVRKNVHFSLKWTHGFQRPSCNFPCVDSPKPQNRGI